MYIVADIGGTKMRIASSNDGNSFKEPLIIDTPTSFEDGFNLFVDAVEKVSYGEAPTHVVIGLPGIMSESRDKLFKAPHLKSWERMPVKEMVESKFRNAKVYLENDSALVGLGEAHFGAGRGFSIVAYLTVSTGVGGARIVNGKIDASKYGFEPGHAIVMIDGRPHELEEFVSGTAIEKKYGKKPWEIDDEDVWDDCARYLALAVYNLEMEWSPDAVVFGGSMFKEVGIKVPKIEKYLHSWYTPIFPTDPVLLKAELGDLGGLYGGLAYLKNI
jgi:glucokinase